MVNINKSSIHIKFSIVLGCILAVLFIAVPCRAEVVTGVLDLGTEFDRQYIYYPTVLGTLNLHPGAEVDAGIWASSGCTINFHGGQVLGDNSYIYAYKGYPNPNITVYGSNFALGGIPCDPSATEFVLNYQYITLTGLYSNGDQINLTFFGAIPIHLVTLDSDMEIDIKPGDENNNINLKSQGVVPVAALTTEQFDAATIDTGTARFAGAAPAHWSLEDVDGDGDDDVIFHFRTQELDLSEQSTEATLTAQVISQMTMASTTQAGGGVVSGTDAVNIVGAKKAKK